MTYKIENSKSDYSKEISRIINSRKNEIFEYFGKSVDELPFIIYIYDNIESLVSGLKKRGFDKDPDYMCACFKDKDKSLNFFEPKDNPNENEWSKEEYESVVFHELVHGIQFVLFGENYEWFNEGIAKQLDGTYKKGMNYLIEKYGKDNFINMLNDREKIDKVKENLLVTAIDYYNNKFEKESQKRR